MIEIAGNLISEVESFLRAGRADGKLHARDRDRGAAIYTPGADPRLAGRAVALDDGGGPNGASPG